MRERMRTRISFTLAGVTVLFALTACGASEGFITTQEALSAFHRAGFTHLVVRNYRKAFMQFARQHPGFGLTDLAKQAPDYDTIWIGRADWPFGPLFAVRLSSVQSAKKTYANNVPSQLVIEVGQVRKFHILPAGFSLDKLKVARVCNVVVSSYNADRSPALNARFERAVTLLRREC
jgi:hypothetical protein